MEGEVSGELLLSGQFLEEDLRGKGERGEQCTPATDTEYRVGETTHRKGNSHLRE